MKKLLFVIVMLLFFPNTGLSKEVEAKINLDELIDTLVAQKRIEFENKAQHLEDDQKEEFWAIYDQFEKELTVTLKDIISSTNKIVFETESLSEKQMEELIDVIVQEQKASIDIQGKYYKKFAKILTQHQMSVFLRILFLQ